MEYKSKRACTAALLLSVSLALIGCDSDVGSMKYNNSDSQVQAVLSDELATEATTAQPTTEPVSEDKRVRVVAVGDNLVQTAVYREASYHATDGTYDFLPLYENVKDIIQAGDISAINQETLIANGKYEVSGSNFTFNSPPELGDDMIELGFNVFTLANNHLLDKGTGGLEATLDYWDSRMMTNDILVCGAYRNDADAQNIRTMEVNGVTVAFLAYTEHINGYSIPASSPLRVVLTSETDVMEEQIRRANEIADAVIVAAHWGVEDTHTVSQDRINLAQNMVEWGADVILGAHPHTAETMEYITRTDGTQGFVFYSLGNFISAQTDNFNLVGEIADFEIVVNEETDAVTIENIGVIPVINHYDDGTFSNMRLYPYNMYTEELALGHGVPYAPMGTAKNFSMDVINNIVEANIPEEFRKLD